MGLFLFTMLSKNSFGYTPGTQFISSIDFEGNIKTKEFILEREIIHPIGAPVDSSIIIADRNRLENLGLFSEVKWRLVPIEDGTLILQFRVKESIQRTPPIIFPNYKESTGWSLTGLWLIDNLRGMNQSLDIYGSTGGEGSYGINFNDPWIFGNHVSLSLNIGRTIFQHRFLDRVIDLNTFYFSFGRWFGKDIKTSVGITIDSKKFKKDKVKDSYNYIAPLINVSYDTRDLYWNPGQGALINHSMYYRKGINVKDWFIAIWTQSYSFYFKLGEKDKSTILALNTTINRKYGDRSEYWLDYFGNSMNVRGWSLPNQELYRSKEQDFRFGHESIHSSIEIRNEIIPKSVTSLGLEFGLTMVVFADIGMIASRWTNIKDSPQMLGSGIGVRIPAPMFSVLRIDYAWGRIEKNWNSGTLHLSIGQKF